MPIKFRALAKAMSGMKAVNTLQLSKGSLVTVQLGL